MDSLDVNGLTRVQGIIDQFRKMAHFIPLKKTIATQLAATFMKEMQLLDSLPIRIVSDIELLFVSKFGDVMVKLLDISDDESTRYHPQMDSYTERLNQIIEAFLRAFIN